MANRKSVERPKSAPLPGKSACPVADLLVFTAVVGDTREARVYVLAASRGSRTDRGPHAFLRGIVWK